MNEKIKELLSEAKQYTMCNDPSVLHHTISSVFVNKFAELIIQECIDVINNDMQYNQLILHNDTSYKIHNMASLTGVIGKIKNHFRVEE